MIQANINDLIKKYNNFILDQWGVLHDGRKKYEKVDEFIKILKKNNKKIYLISNSSQTNKNVIKETLEPIGFKLNDFNNIITSGEILLKIKNKKIKNEHGIYDILRKKYCYVISNKNDFYNLKEFNLEKTKITRAKFILAMSIDSNFNENKIKNEIKKLVNYNYPMICTNPDKFVIDGNKNKKCFQVGYLANLYKKNNGRVLYLGKPNRIIFNAILDNFTNNDLKKSIMIGDSLETDIQGGNNSKIDTLFIFNGIHKKEFKNKMNTNEINRKLSKYKIYPNYFSYDIKSLITNY